jgi:NADH:ubiquinone oxidoreductase subunit H
MISYEVIMGIVILMVVFLADSMNLMTIVANQRTV